MNDLKPAFGTATVPATEEEKQRWRDMNEISRAAGRGGQLFTDTFDRDQYPGSDDSYAFMLDLDARIEGQVGKRQLPPEPELVEEKYVVPDETRIPEQFRVVELEAVDPRDDIENQAVLLDALMKWRTAFVSVNSTRRGIRVLGPTGTGKTLYLSAAAVSVRDPGAYWPMRELAAALHHWRNAQELDYRMNALVGRKLVVLDDVGAGREKEEWIRDKIAELIERRSDRAGAMLLGSNLTDPQLAEYLGPRAASRLANMTEPIALKGEDQRRLI